MISKSMMMMMIGRLNVQIINILITWKQLQLIFIMENVQVLTYAKSRRIERNRCINIIKIVVRQQYCDSDLQVLPTCFMWDSIDLQFLF